MAKTIERIKEFLEPIITSMGYELLEAEYAKKYGDVNLTIFIGNDAPITLDDCEKVHKAIDEPLDRLDPLDGAGYILNVSSYGIDRPIKTERDFKRAIGKELELALFAPIGGNKKLICILKAYGEESVIVVSAGEEITVPKKNISNAVYHIRFE
ncbi:MAG: ribosome maturation factor RimP [Clostridiales bacterium]|jgi:ribosome maturation factor RimP|nr:ribosome maturation factor RimP [Clostridiales bacterium]